MVYDLSSLMAVKIKAAAFKDVSPHSLVDGFQRFVETAAFIFMVVSQVGEWYIILGKEVCGEITSSAMEATVPLRIKGKERSEK
jgi:hypothetical protein